MKQQGYNSPPVRAKVTMKVAHAKTCNSGIKADDISGEKTTATGVT
jgi:hypothetical protein